MRIAIIGGGFGGLAAAIELCELGNEVVIYESGDKLGGLAVGFKGDTWDWTLEKFYHHIFTNDRSVIDIANRVGAKLVFRTPKTNSFIGGKQVQLDSPLSLLRFDKISIISRVQMGFGLLLLKLIPNGTFLEKWKTVDVLPRLIGTEGYERVWKPLLMAKFGPYFEQVNMAWFWARIFKRTQSLGYFEGGFQNLADKMGEYIQTRGGEIRLATAIRSIENIDSDKVLVDGEEFDKVLVTVPAPVVDGLLGRGSVVWPKIKYLSAQTLVLELENSLMRGYWLNILDRDYPFLVTVEHTNFVDKTHYGNKHLVYLGNYLDPGDDRLKMTKNELINDCLPFIKMINPKFERGWINESWVFRSAFAQPVFPVDYSKQIPLASTKIKGVYVANMSMVYPWDRGVNYAIELGHNVARMIIES